MRKILHADCDCFYAAVEMRDNPSLRHIPLVIGGKTESRGVVATCNYPARDYGIHSAMSMAHAQRLCPHLHRLSPDFDKYREASQQVQTIFSELTPLIEPLSLDEAFLDVTHVERMKGSATWMAQWLKQQVQERVGITISVGVAPNKFLAKIASDWQKPDGLYTITPDQVSDFLDQLSITKLHGVGPATAKKLEAQGIHTCKELRAIELTILLEEFGKFGVRLHELARGIDERPVKVERERKSISVETTFDRDLPSMTVCREEITDLVMRLEERMARHQHPAINKLFVKIRFDDFSITTMETAGRTPELESFLPLFDTAWHRAERPVRLLGVGVRLVSEDAQRQMGLF
ncbi:DNA polymerase IV [Kushneria phyllosphaerae]|uniref:DNA polymerase IV n=1 Tax=Kushneria phyllosphaerae TaxID=2100822 RepID=A0A2R8CPT5_9GAMM|nr:DNA polymerase IV [Kushneria phyllosphaerae]SPJ34917.1 DNA polymerase IV [Kushneria phyllosphaerae]